MRCKKAEDRTTTGNARHMTVRTRDGKLVKVDARRVKDFGTFSMMLEALGSDADFAVPLRVGIDASVLNDVLHWGKISREGLLFYDSSQTFSDTFTMTTAQKTFFQGPTRCLRNLILAALYFVSCFVVANRLLTIPSEIRAFFDVRRSSARRGWVPTEAVRDILFFADRAAVDRCIDASQRCRQVLKTHCTRGNLRSFATPFVP
ncbi:hypothetical protein AAVH_04390 [Aphelenchoides avenae]|nr:hypothetical protein AAVH_04390 [Aphelenchus avenae]